MLKLGENSSSRGAQLMQWHVDSFNDTRQVFCISCRDQALGVNAATPAGTACKGHKMKKSCFSDGCSVVQSGARNKCLAVSARAIQTAQANQVP